MSEFDIDPSQIPEDKLDQVILALEQLSIRTPLDYVPHPANPITGFPGMLKWHQDSRKIRLLCGGNQSGKTTAGGVEGLVHATGLYPEWYPVENRILHPNRGRIIGEDFKEWDGEVLEPKLKEWLPKNFIVSESRTMKHNLEKLIVKHFNQFGKVDGESSISIMTHEQDDGVFEGATIDWAWFDEPPPQGKYTATKRGLLKSHGPCWFTMTPLKEPWIYNKFIIEHNPDVYFLNLDIRDNPYLTEEAILSYERGLTEDEKEARLHGQFKQLFGRVYKEFQEDVHCISSSRVKIDKAWPVYFVADPHARKAHKGIWARVDPFNRIYIVGEIIYQGTLEQFSKEILKREIANRINPNEVIRIGDPNMMNTPSPVNGLTFKQEFASHGLYFITNVSDDIDLGHLAVSGKLSWDRTKPISSTNLPKLYFIKEDCPNCILDMLRYVWEDYKGASRDSKGEKETPQEKYKCFPDCVRYLVMFKPGFYFKDDPDPEPQHGKSSTGYRS